jgi:hypothetical protein
MLKQDKISIATFHQNEFTTDRSARLPIAIFARTSSRRLARRQQFTERIARPPFGVDHKSSRPDRQLDGSAGRKIGRIQHGLGDSEHDRAPNLSQSHSVRHDVRPFAMTRS